MADKRVSELQETTYITGSDYLLITQDRESKKIKANTFSTKTETETINAQLSEIANKGTTTEVLERATKEEINKQIEDGRIANLTIKDYSITSAKYQDNSITS